MIAVELMVLASAVAFAAVGGGVGVKLLWLARRTRGFPELVVGFSLFVLAGVSWPLMLVASSPTPPPAPVLRGALACASLAMALGWAGVFLFTWRVFRPGNRWARAFAGAGIALELAAGMAGVLRALTLEDALALRTPAPSGLALLLGALAVYAWTAAESFHYRALPASEERLRRSIDAHATRELSVRAGKMLYEVGPAVEHDKGTALAWLIETHRPARVLAAGDDLTDVAMFAALEERRARNEIAGVAVAVLQPGETPADVLAAADTAVDGVAGLHRLLLELLAN